MLAIPLPITTPTGKIRVKIRKTNKCYGLSFASKQEVFTKNNYIEWQISYDTENQGDSKYKYNFIRKGETKYTRELSDYLASSLENKIINKKEFNELISFTQKVKEKDEFIENKFAIERQENENVSIMNMDFNLFKENYPLLIFLKRKDYTIEIKIDRKQKAVGVQAMVFLCIPINQIENYENLLNRTAKTKEIVKLIVKRDFNNFIIDTVKVFAVASKQHNEDMQKILTIINDNRAK